MGVILDAIRSAFIRGVPFDTYGKAVQGGVADAIYDLRSIVGGKVQDQKPYPDNPAGTVYLQVAWGTTDGWGKSQCTLSIVDGRLRVTTTGTDPYIGKTLASIPGNSVVVLNVKKVSGTGWTNEIGYVEQLSPSYSSFAIASDVPSQANAWRDCPLGSGVTFRFIVRNDGSAYTKLRLDLTNGSIGDVYDINYIYIGDGTHSNPGRTGGILDEAWPGSAVDTLPQWHQTLGIAYDPLARSVADQQTMLASMETAIGGSTLGKLQAQFDKEFFGRIVVSEAYVIGTTGNGVCGLARCGVSSFLIYTPGFNITGTIYSQTEGARVAAILKRYAPAHLVPNSLLTDLSATAIAITGLGRVGIARTGRAS